MSLKSFSASVLSIGTYTYLLDIFLLEGQHKRVREGQQINNDDE